MKNYNTIVVGCGLAGAVVANRLAQSGKKILILEQRNHIAGNAYDYDDEDGILVHKYGPHIFHTNDTQVFDYLSKFTTWRTYQHQVLANVHGKEISVPINFGSIDAVYNEKSTELKGKLKSNFGENQKVSILSLIDSKDTDISEMGHYFYKNIFRHYSKKQWGFDIEHLDPQVLNRVPVMTSYHHYYFEDQWQGLPTHGYTTMIQNMIQQDHITLSLGVQAKKLLRFENGIIYFEGKPFHGNVVYTGAIDELFENALGVLPYRTLDFVFETHPKEYHQSVGVVNYTTDQDYTRITEFKHLTGQKKKGKTTIVKEFPRQYAKDTLDIPYYPIHTTESAEIFKKYQQLAKSYPSLYLLGRLGEYKYYNMDMVVSKALQLSDHIGGELQK